MQINFLLFVNKLDYENTRLNRKIKRVRYKTFSF